IILNKVLLVGTKTSTYIGKPIVPNAAVHAVVEEQGLDPKVVVFKYKKKKNYRRNIGHRQKLGASDLVQYTTLCKLNVGAARPVVFARYSNSQIPQPRNKVVDDQAFCPAAQPTKGAKMNR
ncbi:hypothetical protein RJ639_029467, partial [Escallonia herrerae]